MDRTVRLAVSPRASPPSPRTGFRKSRGCRPAASPSPTRRTLSRARRRTSTPTTLFGWTCAPRRRASRSRASTCSRRFSGLTRSALRARAPPSCCGRFSRRGEHATPFSRWRARFFPASLFAARRALRAARRRDFGDRARRARRSRRHVVGLGFVAAGALSLKGASAAPAGEFAAAPQGRCCRRASPSTLAALQASPSAATAATAQDGARAPSSSGAGSSCAPDPRGLVAQARIYFDSARGRPQPQYAFELARVARGARVRRRGRARLRPHGRSRQSRSKSGAVGRSRRRRGAAAARGRGARAAHRHARFAWDRPAVSPEASAGDRARNRRVEIIVRQGSR